MIWYDWFVQYFFYIVSQKSRLRSCFTQVCSNEADLLKLISVNTSNCPTYWPQPLLVTAVQMNNPLCLCPALIPVDLHTKSIMYGLPAHNIQQQEVKHCLHNLGRLRLLPKLWRLTCEGALDSGIHNFIHCSRRAIRLPCRVLLNTLRQSEQNARLLFLFLWLKYG